MGISNMNSLYPAGSGYTSPRGYLRYWQVGEHRELYDQLVMFMDKVLGTSQVPFINEAVGEAQRVYKNPATFEGYVHLADFLSQCDQLMDLCWQGYAYSPDFELFFNRFPKHALGHIRRSGMSLTLNALSRDAILYNGLVADLRSHASHPAFVKRMDDWTRNLHTQATSMRQRIEGLHQQYKRLVPLRLDFYYSEGVAFEVDAMQRVGWGAHSRETGCSIMAHSYHPGAFESRARIDTALAMQHRERFFQNQQGADRELFEHLAGYVCKLETGGKHRANHFHLLFLFDGERIPVTRLDSLVYRATDRWKRVTGDVGLVFDSRDRADVEMLRAQGRWGLDPVNQGSDREFERLAQNVLGYFTKDKGQMPRVKPTPKAHTLTMSIRGCGN